MNQLLLSLIIGASSEVTNEDIANIWNKKASEWSQYISNAEKTDVYRTFISDPVLWRLLGDVNSLNVLDAGCGEGYLARRLAHKGAKVVAIDISEKLIEIAKEKSKGEGIDFRVESSHALRSLTDNSFDRIVSNYVIMDLPDLKEAASELYRVLKPGGEALLVFLHPCFPIHKASATDTATHYEWNKSYFEDQVYSISPWGDFTENFTVFHRPLSKYWKAFRNVGFELVDFEEPRLSEEGKKNMSEEQAERFKMQPQTVVFLLKKPHVGNE